MGFSAVVVFQPQSELYFPQTGKIMACNSGRTSLLYSAFPLFITHQPPPLWFSLFLCPPRHHLLVSLFCPAGEQGLIWRDHNNSCNSLAFTGAPQARPGPRVQCQAHMCSAGRAEILVFCPDSAVSSHDHILAPPPASLFFNISPNPTPVSDSCAHIPAGLHARAVKRDTGEDRREERSPV